MSECENELSGRDGDSIAWTGRAYSGVELSSKHQYFTQYKCR